MQKSLFCTMTLILFVPFSLETQAARGEPCSDGSLKGWAKKQGYTQADCNESQSTANTAPSITITTPSDGAHYEQGMVPIFSGQALDPEDGDLSAAIQWSPATSALPSGSHQITASVTDSEGLTSDAVVTVTIAEPAPPPNTAPTLNITSPADDSQIEQGTAITLTASASDAEDGDLSGAVSWSPAANGEALLLPVGAHVVTASVTDSGGISMTQQVLVTVIASAPEVSGTADLNWTIPTARMDGSPLSPSELAGYEIYATHEESGTDQVINISDPLIVNHAIVGLAAGTHHFAIISLDTNGLKSELSPVISMTFSSPTGG